jgi:AraC-like DNA-binding protein
MLSDRYLSLREVELPASVEWPVMASDWRIIRVNGGLAYCLGVEPARELSVGEVLVCPPGNGASIRASRLGSVHLHYFDFQPASLQCLLSLSEQHRLEVLAGVADGLVRYIRAGDPLTADFAALCEAGRAENRLLERCRLLLLAVSVLSPKLAAAPPPTTQIGALPRFLGLVEEISEAEVLKHSPKELALLCGCSQRHFARMFRKHFGISHRTRQKQLRLERARLLVNEG